MSLAVPHEKEVILDLFAEIIRHSCGRRPTHKELNKTRSILDLNPALEFLLEKGFIGEEIMPGLDDLRDARRFFAIPGTAGLLFNRRPNLKTRAKGLSFAQPEWMISYDN